MYTYMYTLYMYINSNETLNSKSDFSEKDLFSFAFQSIHLNEFFNEK